MMDKEVHIKINADIYWVKAPKDTEEKVQREATRIRLQAWMNEMAILVEKYINKKMGSIDAYLP